MGGGAGRFGRCLGRRTSAFASSCPPHLGRCCCDLCFSPWESEGVFKKDGNPYSTYDAAHDSSEALISCVAP